VSAPIYRLFDRAKLNGPEPKAHLPEPLTRIADHPANSAEERNMLAGSLSRKGETLTDLLDQARSSHR
jgi:hypothetical protein